MNIAQLRRSLILALTLGGLTPGLSAAPDIAELGMAPIYETLNPERSQLLDDDQIAAALVELPGWEVKDGMLFKVFATGSFREAVALVLRVSYPAEALDHHPDIHIVYGKVYLGFTTHDQGNLVTNLDVEAAKASEAAIAGAYRGTE